MSIESPHMPSAPERLYFVQALRGVAALLVVLSHIYNEEVKHSADFILGAWAKFGMAGVDLFFVISGFIMVYVTWKIAPNVRNVLRFLFGRFSRIYPLYWLITACVFAAYLVWPDSIFATPRDTQAIWKSFALWPTEGPMILIVGWTLVHELYFYLIFALLLGLPHKFRLVGLGLWGLVTLGVLSFADVDFGPVGGLIFSPYNFEFLAGAAAAWMYRARPDFGSWKLGLSAALLALAGGLYLLGDMPPEPHIRALAFSLPCAGLIWALTLCEAGGNKPPRALIYLGDWSYSLYLSHVIVVVVLGRMWGGFASDASLLDNIAFIGACFAAAVMVSAGVYIYAERPMLRAAHVAREKVFPRAK